MFRIIKSLPLSAISFVALVAVFSSALIVFGGWLDPSSNPPGGNVSAPVTVSEVGQIKAGGLELNGQGNSPIGLLVAGNPAGPDCADPIGCGRVGIGTVNPVARFEIQGYSNISNSYTFGVKNSDGAYTLVVRDDGNVGIGFGQAKVGIGTLNPSSKLTVAGIIESASGGIKFPDGTVQTTAVDTKEALLIIRGSVSAPKSAGGQILAGTGFTISDFQGLDKITFPPNTFSGRPTITLNSYGGFSASGCFVSYAGTFTPTKNAFYVDCGGNTIGYDFIVAGPQ